MLELQPITFHEAREFVLRLHRHNPITQGWKFGCAVNDGEKVVGVIVCGHPVARMLDDGWTLEVTRCCTDGTKHAASMLYGAAWRAAQALGYRRLITYTLETEPGTSLRAVGWKELYTTTRKRSWNMPGRPRVDKHVASGRTLWEAPGAKVPPAIPLNRNADYRRKKKEDSWPSRTCGSAPQLW